MIHSFLNYELQKCYTIGFLTADPVGAPVSIAHR